MPSRIHHAQRWIFYTGACLLLATAMTGCSTFDTSYVVESEPAPTLQATASAEQFFVAEPFSLIAADSVGLAAFGYEIARWGEMSPHESLAKQN